MVVLVGTIYYRLVVLPPLAAPMVTAAATILLLGTAASIAPPVQVQQFGMCQCPMTSTWFSAFCK